MRAARLGLARLVFLKMRLLEMRKRIKGILNANDGLKLFECVKYLNQLSPFWHAATGFILNKLILLTFPSHSNFGFDSFLTYGHIILTVKLPYGMSYLTQGSEFQGPRGHWRLIYFVKWSPGFWDGRDPEGLPNCSNPLKQKYIFSG